MPQCPESQGWTIYCSFLVEHDADPSAQISVWQLTSAQPNIDLGVSAQKRVSERPVGTAGSGRWKQRICRVPTVRQACPDWPAGMVEFGTGFGAGKWVAVAMAAPELAEHGRARTQAAR